MSLYVDRIASGLPYVSPAASTPNTSTAFADMLEQASQAQSTSSPVRYASQPSENLAMLGLLMQSSLDGGMDSEVEGILTAILMSLFMENASAVDALGGPLSNSETASGAELASSAKASTPTFDTYSGKATKADDVNKSDVQGRYTEVVQAAISRLGDPYSQKKAGQGDYIDCSYLSRFCYREVGIELPRTAAAQAKFCADKGLTIDKSELKQGDLIFFSLKQNGRYKNISHVGIYAGNGMMVDASSANGKVVYRELFDEGQIMYARPGKLKQAEA